MPIIKRYPNRKLYDTEAKKYITLDGIADMIRQGAEVQVVDHMTNEDLTAVTLTQIIFEQEKKQGGFLPTAVLRGLVATGGETFNAIRRNLTSSLDLLHQVDDEIDRRLQALINRGDIAREEGLRLRDKLITQSSRLAESLLPAEPDLEMMLKKRGIPTRSELKEINHQLELLSEKLDDILTNRQT